MNKVKPVGDYFPSKHTYKDKFKIPVKIVRGKPLKNAQIAPSFCGYKSPLKTLWKKGALPTVTKGLYGDILTLENCSLDHLLPISKGGKTELGNLALASKEKNALRGSRDLKEVLNRKQAIEYVKQFAPYQTFRGYITDILRTFEKLGVF